MYFCRSHILMFWNNSYCKPIQISRLEARCKLFRKILTFVESEVKIYFVYHSFVSWLFKKKYSDFNTVRLKLTYFQNYLLKIAHSESIFLDLKFNSKFWFDWGHIHSVIKCASILIWPEHCNRNYYKYYYFFSLFKYVKNKFNLGK